MGVVRTGLTKTVGQSNAQVVTGSLRFDSTQTQYLSRTPGSAGNRRTWTWSGWYKRGKLAPTRPFLFGCDTGTGGNDFFAVEFESSGNKLMIQDYGSGSPAGQALVLTSQVFRDPSAWYHIVIAVDTTQTTNTNRIKVYVNGTRVTAFSQYDTWTQDYQTKFNRASETSIGNLAPSFGASGPFDGMMSQVYFIDGQALDPSYFGFTDPLTNTWRPKKYKPAATPNNGTTWSSYLTTNAGSNFDGSYPVTNAFDNSSTTKCLTANNANGTTTGTSYIQFNSPSSFSGTLKVICDNGNAVYNVTSGSPVLLATQSTGLDDQLLDCGTVTGISSIRVLMSGGSRPAIGGIYINGVGLIDSLNDTGGVGTNGFYLPFDTDGVATIGIGTDRSGRGNHWTTNNFVTTAAGIQTNPNIMPDSPSGISFSTAPTAGIGTTTGMTKPSNYATLNPLDKNSNATLSNGNLDYVATAGSWKPVRSTIGIAGAGKWYWEILIGGTNAIHGIATQSTPLTDDNYPGIDSTSYGYLQSGVKYNNGSSSSYGNTFTTNDAIGVAYDASNGRLWFSKNNTWQASGDPVAGTNAAFTGISTSLTYFPMFAASVTGTTSVNFGQKPFKYAPPSGFLPLCTANLPRPTTDAVVRPDKYVGIVTYTGNGSNQTVSGLKFKPDLIWIKSRNDLYYNYWQDSVRGSTKTIFSNTSGQETTNATGLTAITPSGFTVGSGQEYMAGNVNNVTYVAWCWKAGGSGGGNSFWKDDVGYATTTAAGLTAGSRPLTGASVNTKAGFSIVTFTSLSPANNPHTMAHGLTQAPEFILAKARTSNTGADAWFVYHKDVGNNKYMELQSTSGPTTYQVWNNTTPTSSVFSMGSGTDNGGIDWVAYLWHSVPGYSKIGSYSGTGVAGNFVHTGFRPKWIMIKNYSGGSISNWALVDSTRSYANVANHTLAANLDKNEGYYAGGESVFGAGNKIDLVSNGFVLREGNSWGNETSTGYIYIAFAESPSFNLYGGQSNAR